MPPSCALVTIQDPVEDEDEESSDVMRDEQRMKAVKDSNKQKERDAVLRGTDITLRVASHNTVDVKNNVEKGQHSFTDASSFWFVYQLVVPGLNDPAFAGAGRSDKRATIREVPGHVPPGKFEIKIV